MSRHRNLLALILAVVAICGCARATVDLPKVADVTKGQPLPVLGGIPHGILRQWRGEFAMREILAGQAVTGTAAKDSPEMQTLFRQRGAPDAIAVEDQGRRVIAIYAPTRTAYVFAAAAPGEPLTLRETRTIAEETMPLAALGDFTPSVREELDAHAAGAPRAWAVLLRLLATVPPSAIPSPLLGITFTRANPWILAAMNLPYDSRGAVVTTVIPGGPADGLLQRGDVIVGIDGVEVTSPEELAPTSGGRRVLSYQRSGVPGEVTIDPVLLPFVVDLDYVRSDIAFAGAANGRILLTSKLEKGCDDDMLAFILGHELGHMTGNHMPPAAMHNSAAGTVARVLMAPVFFVPIAGNVAASTIDGLENRYNHEQEFEADRSGVRYAVQAGYDPAGAVRAARYLESQGPKLTAFQQFANTHPPYDDRVAVIEKLAAELCPTPPCPTAP